MERTELKEILWRSRRLQFSKRSMMDKMQELELMAQKCTASYGGVVVSGGDQGSRLEAGIVRILEYQDKCKQAFERYSAEQNEARELINRVGDPIVRRVLECRYLFGMNWYQIADDVQYTRQHVARLHGMGVMQILKAVNAGG